MYDADVQIFSGDRISSEEAEKRESMYEDDEQGCFIFYSIKSPKGMIW